MPNGHLEEIKSRLHEEITALRARIRALQEAVEWAERNGTYKNNLPLEESTNSIMLADQWRNELRRRARGEYGKDCGCVLCNIRRRAGKENG